MCKRAVTFHFRAEVSALGKSLNCDRSHALNEKVSAHLEIQRWQMVQIHKSVREADEGKLLAHAKVKQVARKWRR